MESLEFLNKVEIRGVVGRVFVKAFGDQTVTNFSVVTEYAYRDKNGSSVVDVTWWNVSAWDLPEEQSSQMKKGAWVDVTGRLRCRRYESEEEQRVSYEIIASSVKVLAVMNKA